MEKSKIELFENQPIRTAWNETEEEWYFSIVDVVGILTDQKSYDGARDYRKVLKKRLKDEGSQLVTDCNQLKLQSPKDGKRYNTDVATTEQLLRIIQSIPSKKAEPFKMWLAKAHELHGLEENKSIARQGGRIVGNARKEIEQNTGKPVITSQNSMQLNTVVTNLIENPTESTDADQNTETRNNNV